MNNRSYHETRFAHDPKRDVVWKSLWRFHFSKLISPDDCVLDIGCGYGSFINQVSSRKKIALDQWAEFPQYLKPGTVAIVGDITDLDSIEDKSVDFVFLSNVAEHLSKEALATFLAKVKKKLTTKGTLNFIQPNYRFCSREYFDDFTHVTVYSHVTLTDFLQANGYDVFDVQPKFLPLSLKSRLPTWPFLIWLYLHLPIKPMGKQMLIRARAQQT